jgi:hypothetical protein
MCCFATQAQQKISGTITDQETKEPLPFSSIAVPNSTTGTMTNANGEFELQLKEDQNQIQISYVGYIDTLITVDVKKNVYEIEVKPYTFSLTEIIVFSLTPLEYIQKALEKHPSLIPDQPFESQAFFAAKSGIKNDDANSYEIHEAVYKTYFSDYANDTLEENSQLILYNHIREGGFESILEKNKRLNKMAKESKNDEEEESKVDDNGVGINSSEKDNDNSVDFNINGITGAGPSGALEETKSITNQQFFDEEYFKKFKYTFGEQTFYQGRELIKIDFTNKRKVEHAFYNGSIYLDYQDLAIVAVDYNVKAKIPFYINVLLKTIVGITISEVTGNVKIRNQAINGKWYPKELVSGFDITLKQKKEFETMNIAQVLNFGKIILEDPSQIEADKIFSEEEEYEVQIYPIPGVDWEDVNVIRME